MLANMSKSISEPLFRMMKQLSYEKREVTLASGRKSNFYFDTRKTALHAEGSFFIGKALFQATRFIDRENTIRGVGGMTLGADPLATALSLTSFMEGYPYHAFIVRKELKAHGTKKWLEGDSNIPAGSEVLVLEDVITTGTSALTAAQRVIDAGYRVRHLLAVVDREEGGKETIEKAGFNVYSLFHRHDFET